VKRQKVRLLNPQGVRLAPFKETEGRLPRLEPVSPIVGELPLLIEARDANTEIMWAKPSFLVTQVLEPVLDRKGR